MNDPRIQQFRQMVEADPQNAMGHYSLGKAYLESGSAEDACASLARALELNPKMPKTYQLLGDANDRCGRREQAMDVLTKGIELAEEQGDTVVRDAIAGTLRQWGAPVPGFAATGQSAADAASGEFRCSRCACPTGQLEKPPFKGPLGEKIRANVCETCWREWIPMGTKVINELGLTLASEAGQEAYDQYMIEFLQIEGR